MKRNLSILAGVGLSGCLYLTGQFVSGEESHDFARYQIIIEKSPFGAVTGAPDALQPNFSQKFSFVGLARTAEDKPLLAFIHNKERNLMNLKAEGESFDGVTVDRIEKTPPKLVLKQGLEVATLTLEERPSAAVQPAAQLPGQPTQPIVRPAPGPRRIPFRRGE